MRRLITSILTMLTLLVPSVLTFAQLVPVAEEKPVVREIPVQGLKANPRGRVTMPTEITNRTGLAKAIANKETLVQVQKQVDFKKSKLLLFSWQGSGGDRLTPTVRSRKQTVVFFQYQAGATDDVASHVHLFAIPKAAEWKVIRGRLPEEETERFNFNNIEIGEDPEPEVPFDQKRLEDLSVPGPQAPLPGLGLTDLVPKPNVIRQDVPEKRFLQNGGNADAKEAIEPGLNWLAHHQAKVRLKNGTVGGYWSLDKFPQHASPPFRPGQATGTGRTSNDVAGTAFGLLPMIHAGMTHRKGKWQKQVGAGAAWLIEQQDRKNGSFSWNMYAHGLATLAMAELYGQTGDPLLKRSAQNAVNFIVYAQDPKAGGWRYAPRQGSDTSVTGWQVHALHAARTSGLNVPRTTLKLAEKWLDSVETKAPLEIERGIGLPIPKPKPAGKFGYTVPAGRQTLTAVGLLCRTELGGKLDNPSMLNGLSYLSTLHTTTRIDNNFVNPILPNLKAVSAATVRSEKARPHSAGPMKTHYLNLYCLYPATKLAKRMGGEVWSDWNQGFYVDPNGKQVRPSHLLKWDKNQDGLTKTELINAAEGDDTLKRFLTAEWDRIKQADRNKDGRLTKAELTDKKYLTWIPGMRDVLIHQQEKEKDSPHFGSWDPRGDRHSTAGGRIMKTSLCLLCLEVYYQQQAKK